MPSPTAIPLPQAALGSLTAAFRSRESLSSSSSLPRSPASSASLPSLTDAGSSSSSCSSLASLSSHIPAPNEHLAVLLPRNLWKQDTDASHCDTFVCRKPFTLMERRHVRALHAWLLPNPCVLTFSCLCSIAESVVASFVAPALHTRHLSSTRRPFHLCILRVVHPSLLMRPLPRLFFLHACAMRVTPKSTALPRVTRLHHRPRHLRRFQHLHPLLVGPLPRAAHVLSHCHLHLRILRSPMTCGITLFGSGPIFARPPEGEGGRLSRRLFLIT
jgi:hypothetical protein